jgi:hypothetical protein
MNEKSPIEQYIENINENILPFIDYDKLQESYSSDMVYAKGILNSLHEAMIESYGGIQLDEDSGEDGFVVIPGVVRGKESGNIALALLDLDLSSSGEHWGTSFLGKHGVVSQNEDAGTPAMKDIRSAIGSYDYCYSAEISGDIHINKSALPKELKAVLNDFRQHKADLSHPPDKPDKRGDKPSLLDGVKEAEKEIKENDKSSKEKNKTENKKSKPEL